MKKMKCGEILVVEREYREENVLEILCGNEGDI